MELLRRLYVHALHFVAVKHLHDRICRRRRRKRPNVKTSKKCVMCLTSVRNSDIIHVLPSALLAFFMLPASMAVRSLFLLCRSWPQGALFPFGTPFRGNPLGWVFEIKQTQSWKPWASARSDAVCPLMFLKLNERRAGWDQKRPGRHRSVSSSTV